MTASHAFVKSIFIDVFLYRYSEKEVTEKVNMFRKMLMAKEGVSDSPTVEKDEFGRPV